VAADDAITACEPGELPLLPTRPPTKLSMPPVTLPLADE
jgi:hypothetical protein